MAPHPLSKFSDLAQNLTKLMEECGEVTQVCSKTLLWGLDDRHPKTLITNKDHLQTELGQLILWIQIITHSCNLDAEAMMRARQEKLDKLPKWYASQFPHPNLSGDTIIGEYDGPQ